MMAVPDAVPHRRADEAGRHDVVQTARRRRHRQAFARRHLKEPYRP